MVSLPVKMSDIRDRGVSSFSDLQLWGNKLHKLADLAARFSTLSVLSWIQAWLPALPHEA